MVSPPAGRIGKEARFLGFCVYVSLVGGKNTVPVKILRDTASFDTHILSSVLPFSDHSDMRDCVLMQAWERVSLPVPLHVVTLNCDFVCGRGWGWRCWLGCHGGPSSFTNRGHPRDFGEQTGWQPCLWVRGSPPPRRSSVPTLTDNPHENALGFPDVFTTCAVALAMNKARGTEEH